MYGLEVYFEVYKHYCKPPQNFDFWKTELSFKFAWFECFHMGLLFLTWWENGTYCLSFVLFGHENRSSEFLQKAISNMVDSYKNIQKKSKCSKNNTQRESNIIT